MNVVGSLPTVSSVGGEVVPGSGMVVVRLASLTADAEEVGWGVRGAVSRWGNRGSPRVSTYSCKKFEQWSWAFWKISRWFWMLVLGNGPCVTSAIKMFCVCSLLLLSEVRCMMAKACMNQHEHADDAVRVYMKYCVNVEVTW